MFEASKMSYLTEDMRKGLIGAGNPGAGNPEQIALGAAEIPVVVGNRRMHDNCHLMQHERRKPLIRTIRRAQKAPSVNYANSESSPPTLYVFNASSLVKPHAIEQLTAELTGYEIDVAVISETHLNQKHADSSVEIGGYSLFRRDRLRRKGGGVVIYTRDSMHATEWQPTPPLDRVFELTWVRFV